MKGLWSERMPRLFAENAIVAALQRNNINGVYRSKRGSPERARSLHTHGLAAPWQLLTGREQSVNHLAAPWQLLTGREQLVSQTIDGLTDQEAAARVPSLPSQLID